MRWWLRGRCTSWQCATICCHECRRPICRRSRLKNRRRNLRRGRRVLILRALPVLVIHDEEISSLAFTRRQFLRRSAVAVAGAGLIRSPLASGATAEILKGPAKKVLVLGAGMAGLVAAYELT